jgi:hypothetical protein
MAHKRTRVKADFTDVKADPVGFFAARCPLTPVGWDQGPA